MENPSDFIENGTRDIPICSAVHYPTASLRTVVDNIDRMYMLRFGISVVRSIIQSCSVYISIHTYSHKTQQLYIISSNIYCMQLHVSALCVGHHQVV